MSIGKPRPVMSKADIPVISTEAEISRPNPIVNCELSHTRLLKITWDVLSH